MQFHEVQDGGETAARHVLCLLTMVRHGTFWEKSCGKSETLFKIMAGLAYLTEMIKTAGEVGLI